MRISTSRRRAVAAVALAVLAVPSLTACNLTGSTCDSFSVALTKGGGKGGGGSRSGGSKSKTKPKTGSGGGGGTTTHHDDD